MNDRELTLGLGAIRAQRAYPDAADVRRHVLAVPIEQIPRRRRWLPRIDGGSFERLVSVTKLTAAVGVAILSGGLLLAGLLLSDDERASVGTSPSGTATIEPSGEPSSVETTVRSDLVAGADLEVEELQPGVFRVVSDGHRALRWMPGETYWVTAGAITAGPDGSVWSFTLPRYTEQECVFHPDEVGCMVYYRLGSPETHEMPSEWVLAGGGIGAGSDPLAVASDGTIWAIIDRIYERGRAPVSGLRSFDGEAWSVRRRGARDMASARDGSVWALGPGASDRPRLWRLTADGWDSVVLPNGDDAALITSADGDVHLFDEDDGSLYKLADLERRDLVVALGQWRWRERAPLEGGGVYWWWEDSSDEAVAELVRLDGETKTRFPDSDVGGEVGAPRAVGSDGAVWLAGQVDGSDCDGISRFDGAEVRQFLAGTCPTSVDLTPDGSLWVQAENRPYDVRDRYVDTFVITPEAWSVSE